MDSLIVEVDGFTWNIDDRGDGPTVVMCHGFPGLGYSYRHQFAPLVDAGTVGSAGTCHFPDFVSPACHFPTFVSLGRTL